MPYSLESVPPAGVLVTEPISLESPRLKEAGPVLEKCLVVGSNSFSGASFVAYLLGQGHPVIGCSRSPEPHPAFLPYKWAARRGDFTFYQYDLNHDIAAPHRPPISPV